jgi:NAD(P)-dependent dehydrogenase (short-subunit alcohol dehydrogenase family)
MGAGLSSPVPELDGRTVFVTGGARGIGKGITAALLEKGANVVVLEIEPAHIKSAAAELRPAAGLREAVRQRESRTTRCRRRVGSRS